MTKSIEKNAKHVVLGGLALVVFVAVICVSVVALRNTDGVRANTRNEGFQGNRTLGYGDFPNAQTQVLVQDTFPSIHTNQISTNGSADIWWNYPTFTLGSYAQVNNNIRYPKRPDEGTCMPASMCNALYASQRHTANTVVPLPPVSETGTEVRVGYFTTSNTQK